MSRDLIDAIKSHVDQMIGQVAHARHAVVSNYDQFRHLVRVIYHPGDLESAWLPFKVPFGGSGWGLFAVPIVGQQVVVIHDCGDHEHGIVIGATFNEQAKPPYVPSAPGGEDTPGQLGEILAVHQSGTMIRFCKDGTIYSRGPWKHEGTFDVTGPITATGNITAGQATGKQVDIQSHTHVVQHVQGGNATIPTEPPTAGT